MCFWSPCSSEASSSNTCGDKLTLRLMQKGRPMHSFSDILLLGTLGTWEKLDFSAEK